MTDSFRIVIPARYASQRLPGKPLREINGKPMIERVYQAATLAGASEVIVATDDQRIVDAVEDFGGTACMTGEHHSGTDRILEVAQKQGWSAEQIIVNLQGDEPLMPAANMTQVAGILANQDCAMATLHKLVDLDHARDPNLVKLVHDQQGRALYFSRSLIPHDRNDSVDFYCGHIGIYAYRVSFIEAFSALEPSRLEVSESLEQLRALEHGFVIHTEIAHEEPGPGIDTEEDLQRVAAMLD